MTDIYRDLEIRCETHKRSLRHLIFERSTGGVLVDVEPCEECIQERETKVRDKISHNIQYHLDEIRDLV